MLLNHNLIRCGDLNNAIVVVDKEVSEEELARLAKLFKREKISVAKEGILNNIRLRHQNDPARHKLLDVVGDLALVGVPLKAHIMADRPGHAANVDFARKIARRSVVSGKSVSVRVDHGGRRGISKQRSITDKA